MRLKHNSVMTVKIDDVTKKLQIHHERRILDKNIGYLMSLESSENFSKIMGGFLRHLFSLQSSGKQYRILISNLSFLYSEYNNPMAMLLLAYDYAYSQSYFKEASWVRHIILQNFIDLAKKGLKNSDFSSIDTNASLEAVSLSEVLEYRAKTHDLKFVVQELIIQKIDLYSILAQKVLNFSELTPLGKEIYRKTVMVQKDLDKLISTSKCNNKLARLGVLFEMTVLERPVISSKMKTVYKEAYYDTKNRVGSINSINTRFKFSPFNSSNVVVFVRNYDKSFRLCKYTHNATHLFGMPYEDLNGQQLSNFIPRNVAKDHDRFILSYLNGQSEVRHKGKLHVPVMNKQGHMRSTMIFFKPEFLFFNEVYMAALISLRKKNHFPIIYSDLNGMILGNNKQAWKVLSNNSKIEETALFAMFPKLFQFYFPNLNNFGELDKPSKESNFEEAHLETQEETFANQDDYNKESNDELRGKENLDLFLFQMMFKTKTMKLLETDSRTLKTNAPDESSAGFQADHLRTMKSSNNKNQMSNTAINAQYELLSKVISQERRQILENLSRIYKAKLEIETNHYQNHVSIREITLGSIHKTRQRVQNFFKAFALNNNPYLAEVLMVTPESLNNLYKLCSYRMKLKDLRDELGVPDIDHEPPEQTGKSMALDKKKYLTMGSAMKDEIATRCLLENLGTSEFISVQEIGPEDEGEKGQAAIQPSKKDTLRMGVTMPVLQLPKRALSVSENERSELVDKSPVEKTTTKEKDDRDQIRILKEKIHKFTHMVESVKRDLEKDYDSDKIKKLADMIYGSLVSHSSTLKDSFSAMQSLFVKGGSHHSSKESGFADSEFIEGKSMKIEESVSTEQDTHNEIVIEYSDPLKSRRENDQPSTFLNSSSRVSVKTSQDANLIRNSIKKSKTKLMFRKWEYLMYVLAVIFVALKITFKSAYDSSLLEIYNYAESVNLIGNMLRPSSFVYKEALKGWIQKFIPLNLSRLPDQKVFYESQLEHYRVRLIGQVGDITSFFRGDLDISYSFRPELRAETISIFSMALSMVNDYTKLVRTIQSLDSQEDNSFILDDFASWNEMRDLAREVYKRLYNTYEIQDDSRSDLMQMLYLYLGLNYGQNALLQISVVVITMYVVYLVDLQLRQAADIFLRIDKWHFTSAVKKLARLASDPDEKGNLRQSVMDHVKQNAIETEANLLGGSTGFKKAKMTKGWFKNRQKMKDSEGSIVRNYAHISGFPEKDFRLTGVLAFIVALIVNLFSIINLVLALQFYSTLDLALQTSSNINISSSSFFFLTGIQYRQYIDQLAPDVPAIDQELVAFKAKLEANIERAKNIPDEYFQNKLATTYVCQTQATVAGLDQRDLCIEASRASRDYTILEGIYQISLDIKLMNAEIERKSISSFKDFFESSNFVVYDSGSFFLTTTMRVVTFDYLGRILPFIGSMRDTNSSLLAAFCIVLALVLFLYHFVWLPYRLRHWTQYEETLLVLNDDIINCIYIKSYFGQESSTS
jgi:hypothetical protein